MNRHERGFTLVQLVATLAIVAVLVLAAVPAYRGSRIKAYLAEARQLARAWAVQAASYYARTGSWQGASDAAVGWTQPPARYWNLGPHVYGPDGWPREAWFVANLRPGLATLEGVAWAQEAQQPDYALVVEPGVRTWECGRLVNRSCNGREAAMRPPEDGGGNNGPAYVSRLWVELSCPNFYGDCYLIARWSPVSGASSYSVRYAVDYGQFEDACTGVTGTSCNVPVDPERLQSDGECSWGVYRIVVVPVTQGTNLPAEIDTSVNSCTLGMYFSSWGTYARGAQSFDILETGWRMGFNLDMVPGQASNRAHLRYRERGSDAAFTTLYDVNVHGSTNIWQFTPLTDVVLGPPGSTPPERCFEVQVFLEATASDGREVTTGWQPEPPEIACHWSVDD